VSLGYCSTKRDVDKLLDLLQKSFLESTPARLGAEEIPLGTQLGRNFGEARLSRLFLYPVKSCGGQEVQSWPLDHRGLVGDRCWMVATDALTPLTQKSCTRMCLIRPTLNLQTEKLTLSFPGEDLFRKISFKLKIILCELKFIFKKHKFEAQIIWIVE